MGVYYQVNGQNVTGHQVTILIGQKVTINIFWIWKIFMTKIHNEYFGLKKCILSYL